MAITDWPAEERPREKLLQKGPSHLTDAELLAIFLRTGIKGTNAVEMAKLLLREYGSLRSLLAADLERFCRSKGLGTAKYVQLQATVEMARRYLSEAVKRGEEITSVSAVRDYLKIRLRDYQHEVFACLFLDNRHRIIQYKEMFTGTIDGASVYPREVVKQALKDNAAAVIFAHNHPSGIAEPSDADKRITQRLSDALGLVDIRVLDHFVIGDEVISFAERGLL
ncbi:MAG: DNA repair protein RadC [uncultured Thiotrichaceae bacterium]|uniref:DNA repair protein RadC n=1 Tax=uncultured Thiotrichaceae bacterium TaxID=298394 RepID=A0A6S6SNB3_9GAMM|nr:MAG: DNA repair protein RadC [uncultured Thiotrichaceae bacterium]